MGNELDTRAQMSVSAQTPEAAQRGQAIGVSSQPTLDQVDDTLSNLQMEMSELLNTATILEERLVNSPRDVAETPGNAPQAPPHPNRILRLLHEMQALRNKIIATQTQLNSIASVT